MVTVKSEKDSVVQKPEKNEQQQTKEKQQLPPYRSFDRYGEDLLLATHRHVVDFLDS